MIAVGLKLLIEKHVSICYSHAAVCADEHYMSHDYRVRLSQMMFGDGKASWQWASAV